LENAGVEEKAAQEVENKRLLEAKDEDLNAEDKAKKVKIVEAKATTEKAAQVPEKYDFKVPEGMQLDQKLVDEITPLFKEAKISQAQAQKLADVYVKRIADAGKESEKAAEDNFKKHIDGLKEECTKKFTKEDLAFAAKSRDRFISKELMEALNLSGFANHPEFVGLMIKVGKVISEGKVIEGPGAGSPGSKDAKTILYDKTPQSK
jgi:predicted XRE-type DNA-binding protein